MNKKSQLIKDELKEKSTGRGRSKILMEASKYSPHQSLTKALLGNAYIQFNFKMNKLDDEIGEEKLIWYSTQEKCFLWKITKETVIFN